MLSVASFTDLTAGQRLQAACVLRDAMAHIEGIYGGAFSAETDSFLNDPLRAAWAVLEDGVVIGWIGRIANHPHAWELHPLAVRPDQQGRGLGALLVAALEAQARAAGAQVLYLGADDSFAAPDAPRAAGQAVRFYRREGFEVLGLLPDQHGRGKPDVLLAKPL